MPKIDLKVDTKDKTFTLNFDLNFTTRLNIEEAKWLRDQLKEMILAVDLPPIYQRSRG